MSTEAILFRKLQQTPFAEVFQVVVAAPQKDRINVMARHNLALANWHTT